MIRHQQPAVEPDILALRALAWTIGQEGLPDRLLSLTGLDATDLRARASEPAVLVALIGFLESHEPDLIACATALGVTANQLVDARRKLES
jgi:Protein of unknown function (DUF3572)